VIPRVRIGRVMASRLVLAIAVFAYFALSDDRFFTTNNVFTIFEGFAQLGLAALAIGLTIIAGELDLSIGSAAAVGGILAVTWAGLGLVPTVLLVTLVGAAFGAIQGYAIHRLKIASIVFTLGTLIALRGFAFLISNEDTVVVPDLDIAKVVKHQLWIVSPFSLVTIAVLVATALFLRYSRWGREIFAIGGGRAEAVAAGVPLARPLVLTFMLSGAMAGLTGALTSLKSGSASPGGFADLLLPAATAALIGGVAITGGSGSVLGIAVGSLTLRFVISGLSLRAEPYYVLTFVTGMLLLFVIAIELLVDRPEARQRFHMWRAGRRRGGSRASPA
jgi:ribose/xylose/arabinose/galactoside ABC-type transport system permease subunit